MVSMPWAGDTGLLKCTVLERATSMEALRGHKYAVFEALHAPRSPRLHSYLLN